MFYIYVYSIVHYYNYFNDGWDPTIYPHPRFVSEYGFQSFPALNSFKTVQKPGDNLADLIDHRQHFPDGSIPIVNLIEKHLTLPPVDSENYLEVLIYFSQISQAMTMKMESETYK